MRCAHRFDFLDESVVKVKYMQQLVHVKHYDKFLNFFSCQSSNKYLKRLTLSLLQEEGSVAYLGTFPGSQN